MKRPLILLSTAISAAAILAASCSTPKHDSIQTGDLLFIGIPMDYDIEEGMGSAIIDATGNSEINFIHTAILEVDTEGKVWVIDATLKHGVDRHPLDTLKKDFTLKDGMQPHYEVLRLKDNSHAAQYVENAKKYIGEEYDSYFLPDNGRHYCTELVFDSYIENGLHLLQSKPMNFKNAEGEFPVYWEELFAILGTDIPQDMPGTNPHDMYSDPALRPLDLTEGAL